MKYLKQIGIISFSIVSMLLLSFSFGLKIPGPINTEFSGDSTPKIDSNEIKDIDEGSRKFSEKLKGNNEKGILFFPKKENYSTTLGYVTSLIQITVNWILGILASVTLIYMLYCGFLILSSGADDKNVGNGKKGISNAAITIAGIGLSWLVISAMIWFIKIISKTNI